MKNVRIITAIAVAGLLASCGGSGSGTSPQKTEAASADSASTAKASHQLNIPQPPTMVTGEAERLDFLATHYWDNFDYADLTWIADTTALESAFYAWAEVLQRIPLQRAAQLTGTLIGQAEAHPRMLLRLASVAEHYFWHPNSPFRNEDLYIPVLKAVIASPGLDELYKLRPKAQLKAAMTNRPGAVAANFVYTTANGTTHSLHQTTSSKGNKNGSSHYTLLFFYNPDCNDCRHTKQQISTSAVLSPLIASGHLHVVAIYPDEDIDQWRTHLPEMPPDWTVGYDKTQTINHRRLYDLRAIPCLYLLDRQKRVVLKDAQMAEIEEIFTKK